MFGRFTVSAIAAPHIKFFGSRERGYVLAEVTPGFWRTESRVVDTITQPEAAARTLRSSAVEPARAGGTAGLTLRS